MKKLLIIALLVVGCASREDFCKEHCMDEDGAIRCGNCWADCMELTNSLH